jgi:hypothetical protein
MGAALMTKKLLVAFDPANPRQSSSDFLIVVWQHEMPKLMGIKSDSLHEYGLLVYLGSTVTGDEIYSKVASKRLSKQGITVERGTIDHYLQNLQHFRIGNILKVNAGRSTGEFSLQRWAGSPPPIEMNLP